jgi:hypothetical protein
MRSDVGDRNGDVDIDSCRESPVMARDVVNLNKTTPWVCRIAKGMSMLPTLPSAAIAIMFLVSGDMVFDERARRRGTDAADSQCREVVDRRASPGKEIEISRCCVEKNGKEKLKSHHSATTMTITHQEHCRHVVERRGNYRIADFCLTSIPVFSIRHGGVQRREKPERKRDSVRRVED